MQRSSTSFNACNIGWVLRREPRLLRAGGQVRILDLSVERYGVRAYLEVIAFGSAEYLEGKLRQFGALAEVDLLVAADQRLACAELRRLRGPVIS